MSHCCSSLNEYVLCNHCLVRRSLKNCSIYSSLTVYTRDHLNFKYLHFVAEAQILPKIPAEIITEGSLQGYKAEINRNKVKLKIKTDSVFSFFVVFHWDNIGKIGVKSNRLCKIFQRENVGNRIYE